jgi:hypothetical protein
MSFALFQNAQLRTQTFTTNGTFNVPVNAIGGMFDVQMVGGGAGGQGGSTVAVGGTGGTGGGGGEYVRASICLQGVTSVAVQRGLGGSGGAAGGGFGNDGGPSKFGAYVFAMGGAANSLGQGGGLQYQRGTVLANYANVIGGSGAIGGTSNPGSATAAGTALWPDLASTGYPVAAVPAPVASGSISANLSFAGGGAGGSSFWGVGGVGGNGGNSSGGVGGLSSGYGAGGGGGGCGATTAGAGRAGGTGLVTISWFE